MIDLRLSNWLIFYLDRMCMQVAIRRYICVTIIIANGGMVWIRVFGRGIEIYRKAQFTDRIFKRRKYLGLYIKRLK